MEKLYVYIWIELGRCPDQDITKNELEVRNAFVAAALEVFNTTGVYVSASNVNLKSCFEIKANAIRDYISEKAWRDSVMKVTQILLKNDAIYSLKVCFAERYEDEIDNDWYTLIMKNIEVVFEKEILEYVITR